MGGEPGSDSGQILVQNRLKPGSGSWKIHPVFHASLLRPYHPPHSSLQRRPPPPPPVPVGDHEEHVVEEVLSERKRRGRIEYMVKWKGLPREECTWEPRSHLEDEHGINSAFQRYLNASSLAPHS